MRTSFWMLSVNLKKNKNAKICRLFLPWSSLDIWIQWMGVERARKSYGTQRQCVNILRVSVTSLVQTYVEFKRQAQSTWYVVILNSESRVGSTLRVELMIEAKFEHRGRTWWSARVQTCTLVDEGVLQSIVQLITKSGYQLGQSFRRFKCSETLVLGSVGCDGCRSVTKKNQTTLTNSYSKCKRSFGNWTLLNYKPSRLTRGGGDTMELLTHFSSFTTTIWPARLNYKNESQRVGANAELSECVLNLLVREWECALVLSCIFIYTIMFCGLLSLSVFCHLVAIIL